MNGLRMLYCWHDTGLAVELTLSSPDKLFSGCPTNCKGDSLEKMTLPQSSAVQSLYLLQNISLSLMFFLERSGFFAALIDTRPSSKSYCACRCTHTCLLLFLSKLCTGGAPIPQLSLLDFLGRPEAFFTTIEPLSLKFLMILKIVDLGAILLAAISLPVKPFLCKAMMTARVSLQVTMVNRGRTMTPSTTLLLKLLVQTQ
jgi:hypothetical protein